MRKGRSSRRSRVSRPPAGERGAGTASSEALAIESAPPRVILSVPSTAPSPPTSAVESSSSAELASGKVSSVRLAAFSERSASEHSVESLESKGEGEDGGVVSEEAAASAGTMSAFEMVADSSKSRKSRRGVSCIAWGHGPGASDAPRDLDEASNRGSASTEVERRKPARSVDHTSSHLKSPEAATDEPSAAMERTSVAPPESRSGKKKRKNKGKVKPSRTPAAEQPSTPAFEKASAREIAEAAPTDPDDISVPPAGDVGFDDDVLTEWLERHEPEEYVIEGGALTVPDLAGRKAEPDVVERRTRLARYVQWVVGGALALCVIAGARTAISLSKEPGARLASSPISHDLAAFEPRGTTNPQGGEPSLRGAAPPVAPKAAEPRVAPIADDSNVRPAAPTEPRGDSVEASEAASAAPDREASPLARGEPQHASSEASEGVAEPTVTASEATATESNAATGTRDVNDNTAETHGSGTALRSETAKRSETVKEAKVAKERARASLEKGQIREAIEAGSRAVAIDPTDGESWLLLGAAYQEKGVMVEARRAYTSCVKQAKTGPRRECMKMLQ